VTVALVSPSSSATALSESSSPAFGSTVPPVPGLGRPTKPVIGSVGAGPGRWSSNTDWTLGVPVLVLLLLEGDGWFSAASPVVSIYYAFGLPDRFSQSNVQLDSNWESEPFCSNWRSRQPACCTTSSFGIRCLLWTRVPVVVSGSAERSSDRGTGRVGATVGFVIAGEET